MKKIKLTKGFHTIIDDDDFERVSQHNWCVADSTGNGDNYAIRGFRKANGNWTTQRLQRFLMEEPEGMFVDHINRDSLDNRKSNLRIATPGENSRNCKIGRNNTSGYRGVSYHKQSKKWVAWIHFNNKNNRIGAFEEISEAVKAYNKAAKKHHKNFAVLN